MQLIALEEVTYAGKTNKRGDLFEATDHHGDLLIKVGKAKASRENGPVGKPAQLETTAIKAETEKDDKPHNPRARYKRRDMRAEE